LQRPKQREDRRRELGAPEVISIHLAGARTGRLLLGATAGALLVTACGAADTTSSGGGGGAEGAATISMVQVSQGNVLTGPNGKTVYTLVDSSGKPVACTSGCLAVWPPVPTTGTPTGVTGVTATLTAVAASDGSTQAAANGDPLYYYSGDSGTGQSNGQGLMSFGGTWYALQPSGQRVSSSGTGTAVPGYKY
jgi:predicted lipoprotein with Yx(FWY)xxD motif